MPMNPLPPQAYTKDVLVQAYSWLQHQTDKIKEVATTPDVLVSLYLKAKLQGEDALERPSIQNFKNELKSLAGMMGEFEVVESSGPSPSVRVRSTGNNAASQVAATPQQPQTQTPIASPAAIAAPSVIAAPQASQPSIAAPSAIAAPQFESENLDARSVAAIQEVRARLNLSSESEALRLLIAVGHGQLKNLMK
jgi:hypothetical protein